MNLRIPKVMIENWSLDLSRAGQREIGGVLFGEQITEGEFRVVKATRQRLWGGTETTFNRRGRSARNDILKLHEKFGGVPERFNYLGEWHSHPSAPAWPSVQDERTMVNLLVDQGDAVNFLILIIVKLDSQARFQISARAYLASGHELACEIQIEHPTKNQGHGKEQ